MEQKYKHLKHKYEDMKSSNKAELESLTESWETEIDAKEKEIEKLKFNLTLSPSKDSIEGLKTDKIKLEEKVNACIKRLPCISLTTISTNTTEWVGTSFECGVRSKGGSSWGVEGVQILQIYFQVSRLEKSLKEGGKAVQDSSSDDTELQVNAFSQS